MALTPELELCLRAAAAIILVTLRDRYVRRRSERLARERLVFTPKGPYERQTA